MIDTHTHSEFSADSRQNLEEMVQVAIAKGITYLAITDHQENELHPSRWEVDFPAYFQEIERLRVRYGASIYLASGIEIGYASPYDAIAKSQVDSYPFDTIINSVHNLDKIDLYKETYYIGRSKQQSYTDYLHAVLNSMRVSYAFTQVGHIGYIARYARYVDKTLKYVDFAPLIDEILRTIIERDIILELNTSAPLLSVTPPDIVQRYYALGGRRVTFASDAHEAHRLGDKYADVVDFCLSVGFTELSYCKGRKIYGEKI